MADELLSCPFCGGEPVLTEHPPHEHSPILKRVMPDFPDHKGSADVSCLDCAVGHLRDTPTKAIAAWNHRTPPTPATDERDAVARALCEARIRTVRRHDTKPEDLEAMLPASIDYSWRDFVAEADAALSALAPYRAAEILAAEANERARIVASLRATSTGLDLTKRRIADAIERNEHRSAK